MREKLFKDFWKLKAPWGLLSILGGGASLVTALAFMGRFGWAFEIMSHFRAQYFWFLLIVAMIFLVGRRWKRAAGFGFFALVNFSLLAPLFLGGGGVCEHPYRAVMINLRQDNESYEAARAFIREEDPDLLALLEIDHPWRKELDEFFTSYPYHRSSIREDNFGIAMLSKHPIDSYRLLEPGGVNKPSIFADVNLGGRPVTVIGVHVVPPGNSLLLDLRNRQLTDLAKIIGQLSGPALVLGDFNSSPWSPYFSDFIETSGLEQARKGFGVQPSWRSDNPFMRAPIDHCFHSKEVQISDHRIGPYIGSDHFPLIVEFCAGP